MAGSQKLIFVYNAESGAIKSISDLFRNTMKPNSNPCKLCSLTYSGAFMKKIWKAYVDSLDMTSIFLHKDEFRRIYPDFSTTFPVVLLKTDTSLTTVVGTKDFESMNDLTDLINLLNKRIPYAKTRSK